MTRRSHVHRARAKQTAHIRPGLPPGTLKAPPGAHPTTVRVIDYVGDDLVEREPVPIDELEPLIHRDSVTWVDVVGLADADAIGRLGEMFGMSQLVLEDVLNVGQRPRMELQGDTVFFVSRLVQWKEGMEWEQLSIVFGERFVATFQERPGDCFEAVRERIRAGRKRIRGNGCDYLAYALIDVLIDSIFPVVERFREQLEELEDDIFVSKGNDIVERVHEIKRDLRTLRRIVGPTTEAVHKLLDPELALVVPETRPYLSDCLDHAQRLQDAIESDRELGNDLVDLHISHQGQRLNEIMKVLTIFAALFIPLTFVAGIYGMNFDPGASRWNMPELGWAYGYPAALTVMAFMAAGLMWYFVRKGWIGRGG